MGRQFEILKKKKKKKVESKLKMNIHLWKKIHKYCKSLNFDSIHPITTPIWKMRYWIGQYIGHGPIKNIHISIKMTLISIFTPKKEWFFGHNNFRDWGVQCKSTEATHNNWWAIFICNAERVKNSALTVSHKKD